MTVYVFDGTMDGLLTAVFDAFARKELSVTLLMSGDALPLFCDNIYKVCTDEEKARRVWTGLEKRLSPEAVRLVAVSWLSELRELNQSLFHYICKAFAPLPKGTGSACRDAQPKSIERNFADPDVLAVTNIARRVLHEQLRMKQFIRFQKAKDGTYLAVVAPDHNVLPLIIDHFADRFNDQPWLIYDARRHYGYYYPATDPPADPPTADPPTADPPTADPPPTPPCEGGEWSHSRRRGSGKSIYPPPSQGGVGGGSAGGSVGSLGAVVRITFEDEGAVPFDLSNGKLNDEVLSCDDQLLQDLWRTYFKAICIRERMNPRKQLNDMPRRYWKYMTEKQM